MAQKVVKDHVAEMKTIVKGSHYYYFTITFRLKDLKMLDGENISFNKINGIREVLEFIDINIGNNYLKSFDINKDEYKFWSRIKISYETDDKRLAHQLIDIILNTQLEYSDLMYELIINPIESK